MPRPRSIRSQLMALVAAISIPLVAILLLSSYQGYRETVQEAERQVLRLAEAVGTGSLQFTSLVESQMLGLASVIGRTSFDPVRGFDADACRRVVPDLRDAVTFVEAITVVDVNGEVVCSTMGSPGGSDTHVRERIWFQDLLRTRAFSFGTPHGGADNVHWSSVLSAPVFDESGTLVGGVAGGIDLIRLDEILTSVRVPDNALVTIADAQNYILARSIDPERYVGERTPPEDSPTSFVSENLGVAWAPDLEGIDRTWSRRVLPSLGWTVYAGLPTADIVAPARAALLRRSLTGLAIAILGIGLVALLYRGLSRSIRQLVVGTRAAADGRLVDLPPDALAEVVEVGQQLNQTLQARNRAEAAERLAKEHFLSIFENAAFGICLASFEGQFLEVNPALAAMLGYDSPEELRRVRVSDLYRDPGIRDTLLSEGVADGLYHNVEVEWYGKDGSPITVRLNGRLLQTREGDVFVTVVEDVTGVRDLEGQLRQTQKMEAIGRLAGGVAHDFNNLLTVIIGHARMILDHTETDPENRIDTEQILAASERAAALTQRLLAFSRKQVGERRSVEVNAVLRDLQTMLVRLIGEDIALTLDLDPKPDPVMANPMELEQVVVNLVVNARDAMAGGGAVSLGTARRQIAAGAEADRAGVTPGEYVELSVTDTGVGMDRAVLDHAFEPFFTTKPVGKGTGLGLSTVYGIVRQAGGTVWIESEVGVGSTVRVLLPLIEAGADVSGTTDSVSEPAGRGSTVLVVEDEQDVRTILARMLQRAGYEVLEASDPGLALELSQNHTGRIDLTITDMVMPVMKGVELAALLAERRPDMPVLYISGYTGDGMAPELRRGDGFLAKPFGPKELLARVARMILEGATAHPSGPVTRPPSGSPAPGLVAAVGPESRKEP